MIEAAIWSLKSDEEDACHKPFPIRVVSRAKGGGGPAEVLHSETHNFESLAGAIASRDMFLNRPRTKKVSVLCVLDESTPSHRGDDVRLTAARRFSVVELQHRLFWLIKFLQSVDRKIYW